MKTNIGKVVSTKMNKTVIVEVVRERFHPLYKKIMRRSKRFKVHSETGNIREGDQVVIRQSPPISKEKHFVIDKILK